MIDFRVKSEFPPYPERVVEAETPEEAASIYMGNSPFNSDWRTQYKILVMIHGEWIEYSMNAKITWDAEYPGI